MPGSYLPRLVQYRPAVPAVEEDLTATPPVSAVERQEAVRVYEMHLPDQLYFYREREPHVRRTRTHKYEVFCEQLFKYRNTAENRDNYFHRFEIEAPDDAEVFVVYTVSIANTVNLMHYPPISLPMPPAASRVCLLYTSPSPRD